MRLLTKHLILAVAPIAALGLAIFAIAGPMVWKQVGDESRRSLEADAYLEATRVEGFFRARISEVRTIASSPLLQTPASRMTYLGLEQQRLAAYYEGIHWDSPEGYVVTPTGRAAYIGDRQYFLRVMRGDETVGDAVLSRLSGNEVVIIVIPVRDQAHKVIGGVAGKLTLTSVVSTLGQSQGSGDRFAAILDNKGRLLAVSPRTLESNLPRTFSFSRPIPPNLARLSIDNAKYQTYRYPLKDLGWTIVVGGSKRQAQAPFVAAMRDLGTACAIVLVAGLGIAVFAARITSRPIERLQRTMASFESGNRQERFSGRGPLEIEWLGNRFNALADTLTREHVALEETTRALEESQMMLQGIVQNSTAAIYVKDLDLRYIMANEQCQKIAETDLDPIGKTDREVFPSSALAFADNDKAVIDSGLPMVFEEEIGEGQTRVPYVSAKFLLRRPGGEPFAVGGISTNIGELRKTEQALADREAFLSAVVDSLPVEVFCTDSEGITILQNELAIARLGDLRGKGLDELKQLPREWQAKWKSMLQKALSGGYVHEDSMLVTSDGPAYCRRYVTPVWANGQVIGSIGVSVDLTELKRYENEILQLNADLEQRVQKRTEQLSSANADLESFTYRVSHDLRSPLRAIAGFNQILIEDYGTSLPEEAKDALDRIDNACKRMAHLIDDLLNLSRIGQRPLRLTPTDMNALAEDVVNQLREQIQPFVAKVEIATLDSVIADSGLIRQLLANLIDNALKFSRNNPEARVQVGQLNTERGLTYFVRDNGVGFPAEDAARVFSPFERLHRQSEFPGTGIGLATVLRIAEAHGGKAWAESQPNVGTTVFFTLSPTFVAQAI